MIFVICLCAVKEEFRDRVTNKDDEKKEERKFKIELSISGNVFLVIIEAKCV